MEAGINIEKNNKKSPMKSLKDKLLNFMGN